MKLLLAAVFCVVSFAQSIPFPGPGTPTTVPFSPTSLSGIQLFWSANVGSNCGGACSDGNTMTSWADQSGLGNNGTNGAGAGGFACGTAPVYHTAQLSGLPAATFGGTNTCMELTSAINLQTASTIFAVVKLAATAGTYTVIGGGANALAYWMNGGGSGKEQGLIKTGIAVLGNGTAAADTSWHQINASYDNTTATFQIDAASDGTAAPGVAITANEVAVGVNLGAGGDWLNGQIAELIVYNRVLTGPEKTQVTNWIKAKYPALP